MVVRYQKQFIVREYGCGESRPNTARMDPTRESESERTERTTRNTDYKTAVPGAENTSFIPGTISPIDCMSVVSVSTNNPTVEYWKYVYQSAQQQQQPKMPAPHSKKESTISRREALQPDVAYSDIQYTPRSGFDEEATAATHRRSKRKATGIQDDDLRYWQKILCGMFESIAAEEAAAAETEEGDTKRVPPSI